ncbi:MAG: hypothetical protein HOP29_18130 [Phycisphaerales bacterium]|nr:hypothetical protein [Phycisphaerales bacterium]
MSTHVGIKHVAAILPLLCVGAYPTFAQGGSAIGSGAVILTPDDPASMASIEGPWGDAITVRVVTVADLPAARQLAAVPLDPSRPARQATMLLSPAGTRIDINFVEGGNPVAGLRPGSRNAETWLVNTDPAVTAEAEIVALLQGHALRPAVRSRRALDGPTCCVTGLPIVEIVVDAGSFDRVSVPNYALQIVTAATMPPPPPPVTAPGTEFGGTGTNGTGTSGGPLSQPGGDGADPIGSPD